MNIIEWLKFLSKDVTAAIPKNLLVWIAFNQCNYEIPNFETLKEYNGFLTEV